MGDHEKDTVADRNQVYVERKIMDRQKHGIKVRLPKTPRANSPDEYTHLTLLNAHIKMAWIISNRLRTLLADKIKENHHCGGVGNSF